MQMKKMKERKEEYNNKMLRERVKSKIIKKGKRKK